MAEPFKEYINEAAVRRLADQLQAGTPSYGGAPTLLACVPSLHALELKDRVITVADALRTSLPTDWPQALDVLLRALPAPLPSAQGVGDAFYLWPVLTTVERHGLPHPEASLEALKRMTQSFSAEFAVRPFLVQHPELTWATLLKWTGDPNLHVRRWCSEGTRPRLPWGAVLRDSVADPSRGLQLLERLRDDPDRYVQRSVANHLNDVSKDHPDRVVQVAQRWWSDGSKDRRWTVRHGLRTLLKKGDRGALSVIGFGEPRLGACQVNADPTTVALGQKIRFEARVLSDATQPQALQAEWVVHYVKAKGTQAPKVFRGPRTDLDPGESWSFGKTLSFAPITTRRYYPGIHRIEVQVNGTVVCGAEFDVVDG
ncbi:MAG: DNA alkylation repair protein [Myxococcota bacterium]